MLSFLYQLSQGSWSPFCCSAPQENNLFFFRKGRAPYFKSSVIKIHLLRYEAHTYMLKCSVFCHSIGDFVWTRSWSILLLMEGILIGLLNKLKFASFRCLAEQAQNHDRYCSAWKKEWWHNQKPYLAFSKYELDQTFTTYSLVNLILSTTYVPREAEEASRSFFLIFFSASARACLVYRWLISSIHRYDRMVLARLIRTTLELPNHRWRDQILAPDVLLKFVSF